MTVEILKPTMYKLRNIEGGCSYALITLTDLHEGAGTISIDYDYGSWNHMWGAMGGTIRDFILRTRKDYLMDKFTYGDHPDRAVFNLDKTIIEIKRGIIQARKDDCIDFDIAREAYNEALNLEDDCPDEKNSFYIHADNNCPALFKVFDWESFPIVTERGHSLQAFMNEVLPVFQDIIRKEIDNELK